MILKPIFIKVTGTSASEDHVKYNNDDDWRAADGVFKCINVGNRYANLLTNEDVLYIYNIEKSGWNKNKSDKATLLYWNGKDNKFMINASSYYSKYDNFCKTPNDADYPNSITLLNVTLTHTASKLKLVDSTGGDIYIDVESNDTYPTLTVNKWDSNINDRDTNLTYDGRKSGSRHYYAQQNIYKKDNNLAYSGKFKCSERDLYKLKKYKYFTNLSNHFNNLLKPSNSILEDLDLDTPKIDIKSYKVDNGLSDYKRLGLFCTINNVFYFSGWMIQYKSNIPDGSVHDITTAYVKYDATKNDLFGLTGTGEGKACGGFFEVVGLGGSVLKSTKSGDDSYIRVNHQNYVRNAAGLQMYNGFEKYSNVTNGTVYETEKEHQIIFGIFMHNSGNGAVKYTILPKQKIKFLYNEIGENISTKNISINYNSNCLINLSNNNKHCIDICTIDLLSILKQLKLDFCCASNGGERSGLSGTPDTDISELSGTNLPNYYTFGTRNGVLKGIKYINRYTTYKFKLGSGNILTSSFVDDNSNYFEYRDYNSGGLIDTTTKDVFIQSLISDYIGIKNSYLALRYFYPYPNP